VSEPLNDEEFQALKKNWESRPEIFTDWKITRLIATVESLKEQLLMAGNGLIKLSKDYAEENAKLRKPSKNDRRQYDLDYAARAPERRHR